MTYKDAFFPCIFLIFSCLITASSLATTSATLPHIGKLPIQTWTTPQGLRVLFVRSPALPLLDLRLVFSAGSNLDQDQWGLAHLTNAALITGTQTLNADQIAIQFDQWGAALVNDVDQDTAVLGLRALSTHESLESAIKLLSQILAAPSFPNNQFLRLQKQNLRAIQANQQAPGNVASDTLFKSLYGKHGYAHPILGSDQTVTALTRNDLISFYQRYYTPQTTYLILVGNISAIQARTIAAQLAAALPRRHTDSFLPRIVAVDKRKSPTCQHILFPSAQTHVLIGGIGISRGDPDFFPLMLGNHMIGGSDLTSRLFQEVREKKGLAYSVYSHFIAFKEPGPFLIGLQSRNEKANEAVQLVYKILDKFMKEGPSEEEFTSAKRSVIGKFQVNLASNGAMVNALSSLAFYQLPLDYFDNYAQKIQAVTRDQVRQAMQKHLPLDQLLTVMVGKSTCKK